MNPLTTRIGTFILGLVLSVGALFAFGAIEHVNLVNMMAWAHVIVGITWIGLLYYFNFVQVPAVGAALADKEGPGAAGINKYVAPRALFWFRWAALATWITGAGALENIHGGEGSGVVAAFTFAEGYAFIGMGAWLGTIMLFNVWVLIWPNQRKILGLNEVASSAEEIASAKVIALMASRTNTALSLPMLLAMVGYGHGLGM